MNKAADSCGSHGELSPERDLDLACWRERLHEPRRLPDTGRLALDNATLADYCERNHIRRLALFGSCLKGTQGANSDIDLLVEFTPGQEPGLIALSVMELELSQILGGTTVDLRTAGDLSRHFRDEVLRSAAVQYER